MRRGTASTSGLEPPEIRLHVTEYQWHRPHRRCYGINTRVRLPDGVPTGQSDPWLVMFVALLMAMFGHSKRRVSLFCKTPLGPLISPGLGQAAEPDDRIGVIVLRRTRGRHLAAAYGVRRRNRNQTTERKRVDLKDRVLEVHRLHDPADEGGSRDQVAAERRVQRCGRQRLGKNLRRGTLASVVMVPSAT